MATWVGNRYWFSPDGQRVVAYRVIGGVALTTGDPVGPPARRAAAARGFTAWCDEHGWTPCWYSVTDEVAEALAASGVQRLQVAAETWLPLGDAVVHRPPVAGRADGDQPGSREGVEAPMARLGRRRRWRCATRWPSSPRNGWRAKGLPEMGFTLGGLDELDRPRRPVPDRASTRTAGCTGSPAGCPPIGTASRSAGPSTSCAARARPAPALVEFLDRHRGADLPGRGRRVGQPVRGAARAAGRGGRRQRG